MARHSKSIWPNLKTVVRAEPYHIKWSGTYRHRDAAWAQYLWRKGNGSSSMKQAMSKLRRKAESRPSRNCSG